MNIDELIKINEEYLKIETIMYVLNTLYFNKRS